MTSLASWVYQDMKLDTRSPTPLYHQLQDILRLNISGKKWTVGQQIPSEHELCREYRVTRPTVRQALEGLVREGLVRKQHGKGAFVTEPPVPIGLFSLIGTSEAFAQQQRRILTKVTRVQKSETCPLTEGENPSCGWIKLERLRTVNGTPAFFEHTWLHADAVPALESVDLNNQSLFATLEEKYRLVVNGGWQRYSAVPAPEREAKALRVRPGAPLLRVVRSLNLLRQFSAGGSGVLRDEHLKGALQVDLYVSNGPFVLEQAIPARANK